MARNTMKNASRIEVYEGILNMDDYSKEQLITLAFLSSLMIKDENKKYDEIKKLLKISQKIGVNLTGELQLKKARVLSKTNDGKNIYKISDLVKNDIIGEIDPRNILDLLVNYASDIGFFDSQPEIEGILNKYRMDLQECGNIEIERKSDVMKYSAKDNFEQFAGEQTTTETYANLAWLSNKFAHIFEDMRNDKIINLPINLVESFWRIKNYSIHQIIKEKQEGRAEDVLLGIQSDIREGVNENYGQRIFIGLPRYFQPILLHFHRKEITPEEKRVCTDKDDYTYNILTNREVSAIMPLKLSKEKEKLLDYLYYNIYANRNDNRGHIVRLNWYFNHNNTRDCLRKPKVLPKSQTYTSKKSEAIDQSRANMEYIEKLFYKLGIDLPEYMRNFIQGKANCQYEKFGQKVRMVIRDKLHKDGLKFDEINREIDEIFSQVFVTMCVLKPITTLSKLGTNNPKLINAVVDSMDASKKTYDFLKQNVMHFNNFEEFQHSLKTELKDSLENKKSRENIVSMQAKLKTLNQELSAKLKDRQVVSEMETEIKSQISALESQIHALQNEINT